MQSKSIFAADLAVVMASGVVGGFAEQLDTAIERLEERRLLVADQFGDAFDIAPVVSIAQFGERVGHVIHDRRNEVAKERLVHVQVLATVTNRAAEDSAKDVTAAFVAWNRRIRQREGEASQMVGDDAVGHVRHDCRWTIVD